MKKNISTILLSFISIFLFIDIANAAEAGRGVIVHYKTGNEIQNGKTVFVNRTPTYDYTKTHMSSIGYAVEGWNDWNNDTILSALQEFNVVVMHTHGNKGLQAMRDTYLVGRNGNGGTYKAVNSLGAGSASQLKIAIYYGCKTGDTTSSYGDLPGETVNKGAQAAVAWKVNTHVDAVNKWNRLFFESAKSNNIVESFRHADYWLREILGNTKADIMQLQRNEKGNIYGYVKK